MITLLLEIGDQSPRDSVMQFAGYGRYSFPTITHMIKAYDARSFEFYCKILDK